jgi:hypothetical protein
MYYVDIFVYSYIIKKDSEHRPRNPPPLSRKDKAMIPCPQQEGQDHDNQPSYTPPPQGGSTSDDRRKHTVRLFERNRIEELIEGAPIKEQDRRWMAEGLGIDIMGLEQAFYAILAVIC